MMKPPARYGFIVMICANAVMDGDTGKRYLLDQIPAGLWTEFKAKCKREGVSVRAQILKLVKAWTTNCAGRRPSLPTDAHSESTGKLLRFPEPPALLTYMTTQSPEERDAAFLDTYAERIVNGTELTWEIPSTRAGTLRGIAKRMRERVSEAGRTGPPLDRMKAIFDATEEVWNLRVDEHSDAFVSAIVDIRELARAAVPQGWDTPQE